MAESAVLTSAHLHARRAAEEFDQVHFSAAAEQHEQASVGFARAAKTTSDSEALRILKLLEAQHQRLARIVKTRDDVTQNNPNGDAPKIEVPQAQAVKTTTSPPPESSSTSGKKPTSALASARLGSQTRDASPSLARDIASRRGIPQPGKSQPPQPARPRTRQLSPESQRKLARVPPIPPSIVDSQADIRQSRATRKAEDDEGFAKFYSSLTSGTMSKLSSVLAYAGLPLTTEEASKQDDHAEQKPQKKTVPASNDPDVKKIFSKAALDAIEDEHRRRGTLGHGFGPAESFYVVQTGGGTYSYADITKARQQQWAEDDEDGEFVDAKEMVGPPSPKHNRSSLRKRATFGKASTQEELELENSTLKSTLEQTLGRLTAFEAASQDASMAALTHSMMIVKPHSETSPPSTGDPSLQDRLRKLERQIEKQAEHEQKLQALTEKQTKELKKYRHKFDELKISAREKDKLKQAANLAAGDGVAGD